MSRWVMLAPWASIRARLGATLSPINSVNMWLASAASSIVRRLSMRVAGFSVVAHSCSGIISPRPCSSKQILRRRMMLNVAVGLAHVYAIPHLEPLQGVAARWMPY